MFREIVLHDYERTPEQRAQSRRFCGPYRWRPTEPGRGRGFYQSTRGLWMDRHGSSLDIRLELANEILPRSARRPEAYWADEDGFSKLTPVIARLPNRRGFMAGWTMGEGMAGSLAPELYSDPEDAARAAHDLAESDAEAELERSCVERLDAALEAA